MQSTYEELAMILETELKDAPGEHLFMPLLPQTNANSLKNK